MTWKQYAELRLVDPNGPPSYSSQHEQGTNWIRFGLRLDTEQEIKTRAHYERGEPVQMKIDGERGEFDALFRITSRTLDGDTAVYTFELEEA